MKSINLPLFVLISLLLIGCSITKHQQKGNVHPKEFTFETPFITQKSIPILSFNLNGVTKNFLFDTGADVSLIQREHPLGKTQNISGASKRKMKFGEEYVRSLKIGTVDFKNTFALNGDLDVLKQQIPNFGGIIGQTIINKANWQIDFPNKKLILSNKDLSDTSFETIKFKRIAGAPFTYITINGVEHKVIIDLGSSSEFNLPQGSKLAKQLLREFSFKNNERERYTIGGIETITEKIGVIPQIKIGEIEFKNVKTSINVSSQARIGSAFFKDCIVYIDNSNNCYKLKK
jgi:hypothetical protein